MVSSGSRRSGGTTVSALIFLSSCSCSCKPSANSSSSASDFTLAPSRWNLSRSSRCFLSSGNTFSKNSLFFASFAFLF